MGFFDYHGSLNGEQKELQIILEDEIEGAELVLGHYHLEEYVGFHIRIDNSGLIEE